MTFLVTGPSAFGQGPVLSGARQEGNLGVAGETDTWTIDLKANDTLVLRVGATNYPPRVRVFNAANVLVREAVSANVNFRDVGLSLTVTNAGTYSVLVNSILTTSTGSYALTAVQVPGAVLVSAGDEGGALQNGALNLGAIPVGDLDTWFFSAAAGNEFVVRMGAEGFPPWLRVYSPTGALVSDEPSPNVNFRDVSAIGKATNSGIYTVVAGSTVNDSGTYRLSLALAPGAVVVTPGDQGGALQNGARHPGSIPVGDLDTWTFSAGAGDGVMLRMGAPGFSPLLRVYGPAGTLVGEAASVNVNFRDVALNFAATNAGNYTVVVGSTFANGTGDYNLNFVKSPGAIAVSVQDEGGPLQSGASNTGKLDVGDLDAWTFTAPLGQAIVLRVGATDLSPLIRLYGPNGLLVSEAASVNVNFRDVAVTVQAPTAGAYTVVVAATFANQVGTYSLSYARIPDEIVTSPADEGGPITNGAAASGNLSVGDLDFWTFEANPGDGLLLRMGASGFSPQFSLYGPKGNLVAEATSANVNFRDVVAVAQATNGGTYTVVASGQFANNVGTYQLFYAKAPGVFEVPVNDEGGRLENGVTNSASLALGDIDMWSFFGTPGDSNVFRVTATSASPWIRLYGPNGQLVGESRSANVGFRTLNLIHEVTSTNSGLYTLLVGAYFSGQIGPYTLKQLRWAPDLILPATTTLDEGATLDVALTAQDPDEPNRPLEFKLLASPPGAVLSITGSTNARITWPTSEATGPSTNRFVASVTDVVNGRVFIRTNEFMVIVRELNLAPQLVAPADQVINEQTTLSVNVSATDADLPLNPLTYSVLAPVSGMAIDPGTGRFTWTPAEGQGPGIETVTVVVTDRSPSAANAIQLSATNTFKVTVGEVNVAPVLDQRAEQTVDELATLTVTATAADSDLPKNSLTFGLISAPLGMTIDPASGVVTWKPAEDQGPSTQRIRVRVQDSGIPSLSATNELSVVVREVNVAPIFTPLADQVTSDEGVFKVTVHATDSDLPANQLTYSFASEIPPGATLDPMTGEFRWPIGTKTARETQNLRVRVADNGLPALTAELSFAVTIVPPPIRLMPVAELQVDEASLVTIRMAVTNSPTALPPFAFALAGAAPEGLSINAGTGVIFWRPSEAQGPSTNRIAVRVADSASPANSTNQIITIIVREVNEAPVFATILTQNIAPGALLSLPVLATDEDLPANQLSYSLLPGAPAGMTIQASSGVLTWAVPPAAAAGTNLITVRVQDDGNPVLGSNREFKVVVAQPTELKLAVELGAGPKIRLQLTGGVGRTYLIESSADLRAWRSFTNFVSTSPVTVFDEAAPLPAEVRFYRALAP